MQPPFNDLENRVIYEKDGLLVINKPYDIPTSGRSLDDSDALQYWLMDRADSMVWAVHQLDADTTGVNIFTTEKKLVGKYQKLLGDNSSSKIYLAVVYGNPTWETITENSPIGYINDRNLGVTPSGKSAHSHFTLLESKNDFSLIKAQIFTGRTHQIRIHLSNLGHPLVGEEWYIDTPCTLHNRQLLHCSEINLANGLELKAPLPHDFMQFWNSI